MRFPVYAVPPNPKQVTASTCCIISPRLIAKVIKSTASVFTRSMMASIRKVGEFGLGVSAQDYIINKDLPSVAIFFVVYYVQLWVNF